MFDKILTPVRLYPGQVVFSLVVAVGSTFDLAQAGITNLDAYAFSAINITRTNYHDWPDSIIMNNGKVEAVIVPAIGRVMQFKFIGDNDGPLWNQRKLDGQAPDPKSTEWRHFGGDKTWPAPRRIGARLRVARGRRRRLSIRCRSRQRPGKAWLR